MLRGGLGRRAEGTEFQRGVGRPLGPRPMIHLVDVIARLIDTGLANVYVRQYQMDTWGAPADGGQSPAETREREKKRKARTL